MTKAEREALLAEKLAEKKAFDHGFRRGGAKYIAGVDEVGRGPLAGPVVAACVVLPEDFDVPGVDDSKKLSEKKREMLYDEILSRALAWGIGRADNQVIDEINILEATKVAMRQAVAAADQMLRRRLGEDAGRWAGRSDNAANSGWAGPDQCDGCSGPDGAGAAIDHASIDHAAIDHILFDAMTIPDISIPQTSIVKGDTKSLAIGAASIVAKVTRDREMVEYHEIYPDYGFDSNKGYGTKVHYEGIDRCGITPIHRKSFLKNIL